MKQELFEEAKYLLAAFVLILIAFKIALFRDDFMAVLRIVASLFYLFILPGYFILRPYGEKLSFIEKMVIGILLSAAVIGIASYYLGIMGVHIKYHHFLLPPLMVAAGLYFDLKGYRLKKENNQEEGHNSA